ncbi:unnamed protein product [Diabrotica balteata]|uniref:Ionotropic receptor n=1 Tax=Diabrotica balteata TaxID=107213 RepID=A0A9N9XGI3_DIABA|nr:unnamed protein product [Diabrotica balteata]
MRIIFLLHLTFAVQVNSINILLKDEDLLTDCLQPLVDDYNYHTHIFIKSKNFTRNLIPKFLKANVGCNNLYLLNLFPYTPNLFTITYDSIDELNNTFLAIDTAKPHFNLLLSDFIVVTTNPEELLQITHLLWEYRFYRSLILLQNDSIGELYVIDYINSNCGKIIGYKKINECKNKKYKYKLKPIKPNMRKNFEQCSMTVGLSYQTPLVIYVNDSFPGMVPELLRAVSTASGFKFEYYQDDCYLEEFRLYTFDSLFEHFDTGKIDLSLFPHFLFSPKLVFVPAIYDQINMIIPKPKKISYWKYNFLVYQLPVWCIIFAIIPLLSVVILGNAHFSKNTDKKNFGSSFVDNVFLILRFHLNESATKIPVSWTLRILIEITYRQAKSTSFSTISIYEKRVKNLEDLIESDIPVKMFSSSSMVLPKKSPILKKIEYLSEDDTLLTDLSLKAARESFATIWAEIGFVPYPYLYELMDYFNIRMYEFGFYMPKNHIFYEHLDLSMQRVVQCGFLEMLYGKYKNFFMLKHRNDYPSKDTINSINNLLKDDDVLTGCLQPLVDDYNYHTHIFIKSENFTRNFIPKFLKANVGCNNLYLLDLFHYTPNLFTITYDSIDELNNTFLAIDTAKPHFNLLLSDFIVVTTNPEELLQITHLMWEYRFYRSLILLQNGSIGELYVIDYINSNCGKIIGYKKINECKNKKYKYKLKPIKPNMRKNFEQCSMTVGLSYQTPLVINVNDSFPGMVPELLRAVSTASGFKFEYYQDDCYLEEFRLYAVDSLFEHFDTGKIDLSLFPHFLFSPKLVFVPAIYDQINMIIPKPKKIPYWKYNFLVYQVPVWCILFAIIPLLSAVMLGNAHFSKNTDKKNFGSSFVDNIFLIIRLHFNESATKIPVSWTLRILIGFYMFFCLLEITYRQAKSTSFSTISIYEKRVKNLEDLTESDIPVKTLSSSSIVLPKKSPILKKIEYLSGDDTLLTDLSLKAARERFATIWGDIGFVSYPFLYELMDYFNIGMYELGFYMPKNHIFYEHLDLSVQRVVQCGFLEMLYGKYKNFFMLKHRNHYPSKDTSVKRDLKSCIYMFILLFAGYFVSLVAFGVELLLANKWLSKNVNRFKQAHSLPISLREEDSLTGCLQLIVEDSNYAAHFLITSENLTVNFIPRFSKVNIESNNLLLLHSFVGAPNLFTITYSSLDELNTTLFDIFTYRKVSRILSHYIILTANSADLLQISQLLWKYSFYKSLILFHSDLMVELYVIDYINTNCGEIIRYKKINECKDNKYKRKLKPIKPDMKKSFDQCSLTVGVSYLPPMTHYVNDSPPGIVPELLQVVSISSGYKFNIYENDNYINEIREFRFDSVFEDFASGKIDLMFMCNYILDFNVFFVPAIHENVLMLLPKPKLLPYWKNNVLAYQLPVWCCIYALIPLLSFIVLGYAKLIQNSDTTYFGSSFVDNLFMVFGLSLNIAATRIPVTWNLRILIGFYLFFCLLELTYRQAKITSLSAISIREKRIRNMEELAYSDIPFKTFAGYVPVIPSDSPLQEKIDYLAETEENYKNLSVIAYQQGFSTIWGEVGFIVHPFLAEEMDNFHLLMIQYGFYIPDRHIFYENFQYSMKKVLECGFLERLINKYKHYFMLQDIHSFKSVDTTVKRDLASCMFMFIVLFAGYFVSLIMFGVELLKAGKCNLPAKFKIKEKWYMDYFRKRNKNVA